MEKPNLFRGYHYPMNIYEGTRASGGFTQLSLDLSSRCNYRCEWCFNLDLLGKDPEDMLTHDERISLLEQAVDLGAKTLVFPGTGEPTLDQGLSSLIEHAHQLGMITVIYSNLTGDLDPERIQHFFEHDVSIGIKLDSLNVDHFKERYHTTEEAYLKFRENLGCIFNRYACSAEDLPQGIVHRVILNTVLTHENKKELPELTKISEHSGFPMFIRPVKPVTWAEKNKDLWNTLGNSSGDYYPEKDLVALADRYNTLFSPSSTLENHCAIYSYGLTIKNNGDIQVCPDHHESRGAFGNVRDISLAKVMSDLNAQRTIKPGFCVMLPDIKH